MTIRDDIADDFEAYALADFGEEYTHIPDPQTDEDTVEFMAIHTATSGKIDHAATGHDHQHHATIQFLAADIPPATISPRSRFIRTSDEAIYSPAGTPDNTHGVVTLRLNRITRQTFGRS